jgi:hypothetical protein
MQAIQGKVINAVEENAVIDGTTILNTIYDNAGYRLSILSMSKGTFVAPERFRTPTLVRVLKGSLLIRTFSKENRREAVVNEGQIYFRPAKEFAGYYANDTNVILEEIVLRADSETAMRVIPHSVLDLVHMVHYEPGMVSRSHLINDEMFQLSMAAFSESESKELVCKDQMVFVQCIEGQYVITHEDSKYVLHPGETFLIMPQYKCRAFATSRTKIMTLHMTEETNKYL